jgi:outer membrane lipoprotein SlyB
MKITRLLILLCLSFFLAACASSNSGSVYSRDEARKTQTVRMGVVESVRQVRIEGTKSPVGTIAGGAVGGIAGSSVGGGRVAAVIGAVVGGLAGSAAEEALTRKDGLEITVKLDNGTLLAVVQEADVAFNPGERVRLVESGGVTRVTH